MQILKYTQRAVKRLDYFLLEKYKPLTIGKLNKYLRENKIKLNGKKLPLDTPLNFGDEIKVFINDDILGLVTYEYPFMASKGMLTVVFEDENLLAVDKPAGVAVQSLDAKICDTLINRCLKYLYDKQEYNPEKDFTPCLCHRLDTGTSGIVLVAKTAKMEKLMISLFEKKSLVKEYLCVTVNYPSIKKAVLKGFHTKNEKIGVVTITENPISKMSKPVETRYEILATNSNLALLKVQLITGRTHQIRAHLKSIGCPILGDSKYGINAENRKRKMKYQALCAWKITLPKIMQEGFEKYSSMVIETEKPWYYMQIIDKTLR